MNISCSTAISHFPVIFVAAMCVTDITAFNSVITLMTEPGKIVLNFVSLVIFMKFY